MSFASTCSLKLGLCLQSEELKHRQLLSSPGLTYSRCFWKPLLKATLKKCKAELLNKSVWRWKPVPKDLMNSRVEGYEQIWAAHSSGLLLMMYFAIYFMYLEGKLSPWISCVGDSRAGQGSEHRLFCLSLGSVTCCGKDCVWHKQSASELQ